MTARRLLELALTGDAPSRDARRAAGHADRCAACAEYRTAPPLALASLRTPVPLRPRDYAAVRTRVLGELEPRLPLRFPAFARFAAAAAVLAIAIGAAFLARPERNVPPQPPGARAVPPRLAVVEVTPPPIAPALPPKAVAPAAEPRPPVADRAVRIPAPAPLPEPVATIAAAPASGEELRIHIQTADPDIRIIWIVNPTFEPPFSKEES